MATDTDTTVASKLKKELRTEVIELQVLINQERWNTAMSVAGYIVERLRPYASDEVSK